MKEKKKIRTISIDDTLWNKLKELAEMKDRSISNLIRDSVREYLERPQKQYDPKTDKLT